MCKQSKKNFSNKDRLTYSLHIFLVFNIFFKTIWAFDNIENKYTLYHGENCMKYFCTSLTEHASNAVCKKNGAINKKELKLHQTAAARYICGKRF